MEGRAGEVHRERDTFEGVITTMGNILSNLQSEWEGAASTAFYNQFQDLQPSFQSMKTLLDDLGTQLNQTAQAMRDLDADIAGKMGVQ